MAGRQDGATGVDTRRCRSDHVSDVVGMTADTATGGCWLAGPDGCAYAFGAPRSWDDGW
jgi:hypothetical protein